MRQRINYFEAFLRLDKLRSRAKANENVIRSQLRYFCDKERHLVCLPYSRENLHFMAEDLGIARAWFHIHPVDHYDIPKKRIQEITARCNLVSKREIYQIAKGIIK